VSLFTSHWQGVVTGSGSVPGPAFSAEQFLDGAGPLTVLRTRAWCQVTINNETITPGLNIGNNLPPLVFRVTINESAHGPDGVWPTDIDGSGYEPTDVIFGALEWQTPFYIPPNAILARGEAMNQYATLAGGVADSAAQRFFDTDTNPKIYASVNYLDVFGASTVDFTAHMWVRVLTRF
jgi:hypothetical protein